MKCISLLSTYIKWLMLDNVKMDMMSEHKDYLY